MSVPAYVGYAGLFTLIFLGESGLPIFIPAELVLFAAGVASANHTASLTIVLVLALSADFLGGITLFTLVRHARGQSGRLGRVERLVERAARGAHAVGGCSPVRVAAARCIPFLRVPSAFAAALTGLPSTAFAASLVIGGAIWVSAFLGGGFIFTREAFHI